MSNSEKVVRGAFGSLRIRQFAVVVLGVIDGLVLLGITYSMQKIIDALILGKEGNVDTYLYLFFGLLAVSVLLMYFLQYHLRLLNFTADFGIRLKLFDNLLRKTPEYHLQSSSGELLTKITNDTEQLSKVYGDGYPTVIMMGIRFLTTVGFMIYYNPGVTLVVLVIVFLCFALSKVVSDKLGKYSAQLQQAKGEEQQLVLQSLSGFKTIYQLQKADFFKSIYRDFLYNKKYLAASSLASQYSIFTQIFTFGFNVVPFLIILLSVPSIRSGQMTVGDAIAMYAVSGGLPEPIRIIADFVNQKKVVKQIINANEDIYEEQSEPKGKLLDPLSELGLRVESFSYDEKEILRDFSLCMRRGEMVTVMGESGTGKTSLFNMVSGFIRDERVALFFNGERMREIGSSFYGRVLQVEQKVVTIVDTVRSNICFGEEYTEDELREVIAVAQLESFVEKNGMNYIIAEGASNISGGECQRLGIARMLLRKPDLLLLDEPTSALDAKTSERLATALRSYAEKYDITLLVISHKNEFVEHSSQVINLNR